MFFTSGSSGTTLSVERRPSNEASDAPSRQRAKVDMPQTRLAFESPSGSHVAARLKGRIDALSVSCSPLSASERLLFQRDPVGLALIQTLEVKINPADTNQAGWARQLAHESPVRFALLRASGMAMNGSAPTVSPGQSLLGQALIQAGPKVQKTLSVWMQEASLLRVQRIQSVIHPLLAQGAGTRALEAFQHQHQAAFSVPEQQALWAAVEAQFSETFFAGQMQARITQENAKARVIYGQQVPRGIGIGLYLQEVAPYLAPPAAQRLSALIGRQVQAAWYADDRHGRAAYELYQGLAALTQATQEPGAENPATQALAARLVLPDSAPDPLAGLLPNMLGSADFAGLKHAAERGDTALTQAMLEALERQGDPNGYKPTLTSSLIQGQHTYQTQVLNPREYESFLATGPEENERDRMRDFAKKSAPLRMDPAKLSTIQLENFIGMAYGHSPQNQAAFQAGQDNTPWYQEATLKAIRPIASTLKDNIAPGTQAEPILGVVSGKEVGVQEAVFLRYRGKDNQTHLLDERAWDSKGKNENALIEDFQPRSPYPDSAKIRFSQDFTLHGNKDQKDIALAAPIAAHVTTLGERVKTAADIAIPIASVALMPFTAGQSAWAALGWGGYRSAEQLEDLHAHSQSLTSREAVMGPWLGVASTVTTPIGAGLAMAAAKHTGRAAATLGSAARATQTFSVLSGAVMTTEQLRLMATVPMSGEEFALNFAMASAGLIPFAMRPSGASAYQKTFPPRAHALPIPFLDSTSSLWTKRLTSHPTLPLKTKKKTTQAPVESFHEPIAPFSRTSRDIASGWLRRLQWKDPKKKWTLPAEAHPFYKEMGPFLGEGDRQVVWQLRRGRIALKVDVAPLLHAFDLKTRGYPSDLAIGVKKLEIQAALERANRSQIRRYLGAHALREMVYVQEVPAPGDLLASRFFGDDEALRRRINPDGIYMLPTLIRFQKRYRPDPAVPSYSLGTEAAFEYVQHQLVETAPISAKDYARANRALIVQPESTPFDRDLFLSTLPHRQQMKRFLKACDDDPQLKASLADLVGIFARYIGQTRRNLDVLGKNNQILNANDWMSLDSMEQSVYPNITLTEWTLGQMLQNKDPFAETAWIPSDIYALETIKVLNCVRLINGLLQYTGQAHLSIRFTDIRLPTTEDFWGKVFALGGKPFENHVLSDLPFWWSVRLARGERPPGFESLPDFLRTDSPVADVLRALEFPPPYASEKQGLAP